MATYICLINYTEQGIKNVKDSPGRLDAARQAIESQGGAMKDFYLTMGGYDMVVTLEAPSDDVVARFALMVGSQGNVRTTTLRAFDEAEYRSIVQSLG